MSGDTVRALLLVVLTVGSVGVGAGAGVAGAARTTMSAPDAVIIGGAVLPGSVAPGASVADQRVSLRLANLSADGHVDTVSLVFPDALAGNLTVQGAAVGGNLSMVGTPEVVDGPDDDGRRDTVQASLNAGGGGGGAVDATLDVVVRASYPDRNTTVAVDAVLLDSREGVSTADGVVTVVVGSGSARSRAERPTGGTETGPAGQDVNVTLSDPEDVQKAKVKAKSKVKNTTLTTLPTGCLGPANRTPFVYHQDVDVHVNNATGDIGKLKVKVKSKVKKIDFADAPRIRVNGTNASALCEQRATGGATTDSGSLNGLLGWGSRTNAAGTGASTPASGSGGFAAGLLGGGLSGLAAAVFRVLG